MAGKRTPAVRAKYSPGSNENVEPGTHTKKLLSEAELKESTNKNNTSVPSTASSDSSDQRSGYFSKSSIRSSE